MSNFIRGGLSRGHGDVFIFGKRTRHEALVSKEKKQPCEPAGDPFTRFLTGLTGSHWQSAVNSSFSSWKPLWKPGPASISSLTKRQGSQTRGSPVSAASGWPGDSMLSPNAWLSLPNQTCQATS